MPGPLRTVPAGRRVSSRFCGSFRGQTRRRTGKGWGKTKKTDDYARILPIFFTEIPVFRVKCRGDPVRVSPSCLCGMTGNRADTRGERQKKSPMKTMEDRGKEECFLRKYAAERRAFHARFPNHFASVCCSPCGNSALQPGLTANGRAWQVRGWRAWKGQC